MKRYLVLTSLLFLVGVATASAQVTYQITTVPTFVIDSGRAEVLGSIRLTATNTGPTVGSTIQVLYQAVSCDNSFLFAAPATSGITVVAGSPAGVNTGVYAGVGAVTLGSVQNTAAGCIVSIVVANALVPAVGDYIQVSDARGRIDLTQGIPDGGNINASLNASPSASSLFTAPTTVVVATPEPGLVVTVDGVTRLQCVTGGNPTITVKEGFNSAFVQNVPTAAGTAIPINPRLPDAASANANTQIHISVANLPTGVTVAWPTAVLAGNAAPYPAFIAGHLANTGAELQLMPGSTSTSATYEYACGDQTGVCDVNTEFFEIEPTVTVASDAGFGTATAQATLYPTLLVGDVTSPLQAPDTPAVSNTRPRFAVRYLNNPADSFIITGPCTTTLLYPWVALVPGLGYDTGIVVANTSADPSNLAAGNTNWMNLANTTTMQSGTCTLYGYNEPTPNAPTAPAHDLQFTTPSVPAGGSWAAPLSALSPFNAGNFTGYIIAICNFQYGHGFGYITENLTADNGIAQGYIALTIPDPVFLHGRYASPQSAAGAGTGEGLFQ